MTKTLLIAFLLFFLTGCKKSPDVSPDILGGGIIFDPSVYNPEQFLVSKSNPNPTSIEQDEPVIIAAHGYGATTFEWDEFNNWPDTTTGYSISRVLLGGHGRTYEDFKNASWRDWQKSIIDEYTQLVAAGYKKIDFVASSTSCPLLLDMINSGFFYESATRVNIFLIDPIIIPSDKTLSMVGVVGPMLGYVEADNTSAEDQYYYHYRPQETLQELQKLLTTVRKQLEKGIILPANVKLKVYKSKQDPTADPVSAVLIYNGTKTNDGNPIDLQMVDSKLHVFTNLSLRPAITQQDQDNQTFVFTDITTKVLE